MDMVEKVARAIDPKAWEKLDSGVVDKDWSMPASLATARAAIAAMREPTEAMLMTQGKSKPENAMSDVTAECARRLNESVRSMAGDTWREMIDAALLPAVAGST